MTGETIATGLDRPGTWPYPRLIAHRGGGTLAPENTLAAMRVGFDHGYRMVEFDVKIAKDGVAFLLHDDTLDRTTTGRGRADAFAWHELARLDAGRWHCARYAGEALPTLAAVAYWALAQGVACNIEIKPTPGQERETGGAVARDARGLWSGAGVAPLLSSFSESALEAAAEAAPELPRGLLLERVPADWRARLGRLGCVSLHTDHRGLNEVLVRDVRREGFRVLAYTVNDACRLQQLARWGVDGMFTDALDRIDPESLGGPGLRL